ncbi:MAG TPA: ABC transporter permease, partial [Longimicrobiales bacterium]|nr:ABC transporter permease [Longimicrobiales bacterium]
EELARDGRLAVRRLLRAPGFTSTVVLTLAVAIGATTTIFSALDAVVLRPLSVREPERLVRIFGTEAGGSDRDPIALADALDWRREASTLAGVAMYDLEGTQMSGPDGPEAVGSASVSANLFPLLGVEAAVGRLFTPGEDVGPSRLAVLSHDFWRSRFAGDPTRVGSTLVLDGEAHTVVGVLPPDYEDPLGEPGYPVGLYTLFDLDPRDLSRGQHSFQAVARLAPGVDLAAAQQEMDAVAARIRERFPEVKAGRGVRLVPLEDAFVGEAAPALRFLLAAVGLLLLIACVNVASLLLSRSAVRRREVAVRAALGAGRARLASGLLTEVTFLAGLGGAAGVAVARGLLALAIPAVAERIPRIGHAGLGGPVLAFAAATVLSTALLVGVLPLLQGSRSDPGAALRESGGRHPSGGKGLARMLGSLAVLQLGLCAVLLATAGLLSKSFDRLLGVDTGFRRDDVLTFRLVHPWGGEARDRLYRVQDELAARFAAAPGIRAAGAVNFLPLSGNYACIPYTAENEPRPEGRDPCAEFRTVTPGYFDALGVELQEGRRLGAGDTGDADRVVVVDRTMAGEAWPGTDPVGRRLEWGRPDQEGPWWTVVGVVEDVRHFGLARDPAPEVYMTYRQGLDVSTEYAVAATPGHDPRDLLPTVRTLLREVEPALTVSRVATMAELIRADVAEPRFRTLLVGLFSAASLVLAVVGVFGVVSYGATRRRSEIGLRMALGAGRTRVVGMLVGRALALAVPGVAAGLGVSLWLARGLRPFLFHVTPA